MGVAAIAAGVVVAICGLLFSTLGLKGPSNPCSRPKFFALTWPEDKKNGGAQKERRRRCAEKRSSKTRKWTATLYQLSRVFIANPRGREENGLSKSTLPDDHFPPHEAFSAPLVHSEKWALRKDGFYTAKSYTPPSPTLEKGCSVFAYS